MQTKFQKGTRTFFQYKSCHEPLLSSTSFVEYLKPIVCLIPAPNLCYSHEWLQVAVLAEGLLDESTKGRSVFSATHEALTSFASARDAVCVSLRYEIHLKVFLKEAV